MPNIKSPFERIPINVVRMILENQKNGVPESEELANTQKRLKPEQANKTATANNVQKHRARPKRSIRTEGQDHPLGLWIDKEIFRKHQNRPPQLVLHDPSAISSNRYLALADLALGSNRTKSRRKPNDSELMGSM
jgi:hypothetical protein